MTVTEQVESPGRAAFSPRSLWTGSLLPQAEVWAPRRWAAWVSLLLAVVVHAIVAKDSFAVIFGADEVGNLVNSIFFADPNAEFQLAGSGYMPGLGLILSPIWLVTSDPIVGYQLAIAVVALLGVACIWPFAALARQWGASANAAVVIGSIVSVVPARALHSNNVLAENLFVFLLAWLAVFTTVLVQRPTFRNGMTFGLIAGGVWWSHGRSMPVLLVVGLGVAVLFFRHRKAALGVIATLAPTGILGYLAYRAISAQFYPGDARAKDMFSQLLDNDLPQIADVMASQLWYVLVAWSVLVPVGVIGLVSRSRSRGGDPNARAARWILVGLAIAFAHVVLLLAGAEPSELRLDVHVYGRYLDAFTPLVAVIGTTILLRGMTRKLALVSAAYAVVAIGAFHLLTFPNIPPGGYWTAVHEYGITAWMSPANIATETLDPYGTMSLVGALVAVLFLVCAAIRDRLFVVAALLVFATTTLAVDQLKLRDIESEQRYVPSHATFLRSLPGAFPVAADVKVEGVFLNYNLLAYYSYPITFVAWSNDDPPTDNPSPLILSSTDAEYMVDLDAWPINGSILGDVMVWVLPGAARDYLDARGLVAHPIDDEGGPSEESDA